MKNTQGRKLGIGIALTVLAGGAARAQESFELLSISANGSYGNGHSSHPIVSANGRFVAFDSLVSDLVPGDTNDAVDVFVRDLDLGVTERVSVSSTGTQLTSAASGTGYVWVDGTVGISTDGRIVSFVSLDPSVVPGDTNGATDVFVRDRSLGTTTRASIRPDGGEFAGHCSGSQLSGDGTRVLFAHRPPGASLGQVDWYVRDLAVGTTQLVSVDPSGNHDLDTWAIKFAAGGRCVVFAAVRGSISYDSGTFVRDVDAGTTETATPYTGWRAYTAPGATADELEPLAISASGRFVLCSSFQDLDPTDGVDSAYNENAWVLDRSNSTFRLVTRFVGDPDSPSWVPGFEPFRGFAFVSDDGRTARLRARGGGLIGLSYDYNGAFYEIDPSTTETRVLSLNWRLRPFEVSSGFHDNFAASEDGRTVAVATWPLTGFPDQFRFWGNPNSEQVFVRRVRASEGVSICAGDGSAASCPCGTSGIAGRGCANSLTARGSVLRTRGNASISDDSLTLFAYDAPGGVPSFLLQSASVGTTGGVPFEGGVLCLGSPVLRIGLALPYQDNAEILKVFGRGGTVATSLHDVGGITAPGTRYYQVWTRAVGGASCIASRSSLTNGVRVEWRL